MLAQDCLAQLSSTPDLALSALPYPALPPVNTPRTIRNALEHEEPQKPSELNTGPEEGEAEGAREGGRFKQVTISQCNLSGAPVACTSSWGMTC